jgi:TRAP-type uncharacterized transport system fused permease subunit
MLTLRAIATSSIGVIALSAGLQGYLFRKLHTIEKLLLIVSGLLFIETKMITDLMALAIFGAIVVIQFMQRKSLIGEKI